MAFDQNTTGDVGPPVQGVNIRLDACLLSTFVVQICMLLLCRLVDWEEGNYRVTDKPRPRGEVKNSSNFVSQMFRFTLGGGTLPKSTTRCQRRQGRNSLMMRLAGGGSRLAILDRLDLKMFVIILGIRLRRTAD